MGRIREYYASIPQGIRAISIATGIRWIGWGMVQPILPVFLFSIVGNYTAAGVVDSMGRFVFILLLPLAGELADRMDLKKFLIAGLIFFIFDGLGYFIAGLTGAAIWIFFANILDGVGVVSDVIGRSTYIRRHAPLDRMSTMFGFQNMVINAGYIGGMILTAFLADKLSTAWIFFSIVPTTLICIAIYSKYLSKEPARPRQTAGSFWNQYISSWRDVVTWKTDVKVLAGLALFVSMLDAVGTFILPIYAHTQGASLASVALIGVLFNLPWLFAEPLGRIADRFRERVLPLGLLAIAAILGAFAFLDDYRMQLALVLVLEIFIILAALAIEGIVTRKVPAERFGRVSAVLEAMKDFGKFLGPLAFGIVADLSGSRVMFVSSAVVTFLMLFLFRPSKNGHSDIPAARS